MLKTRILTALIGIPILMLFLITEPLILAALSALVIVIGMKEYYEAVKIKGKKLLCFTGYLFGGIFAFGAWFGKEIYMLIIFILFIALCLQMIFNYPETDTDSVSKIIFSIVYISFFLSNANYIRIMKPYGEYYIWLMFLGAFITDSCAYFVGKAAGRHKLCPKISPKKTVEGAVGGIIGTGITFIGFAYVVNTLFKTDFGFIRIFILGLAVAAASELGDLTASVIKRRYKIKDFGNILPGHGGILDRCDSIILVAPVMYLYLLYIGL